MVTCLVFYCLDYVLTSEIELYGCTGNYAPAGAIS